jgi:hypothetical protein
MKKPGSKSEEVNLKIPNLDWSEIWQSNITK